jgi:hypothetical protein
MRAATVTAHLEAIVVHELRVIRDALPAGDAHDALATLETFVGVSLALMRKSNPSKVRDVAMTSEIRWRLDALDRGAPVAQITEEVQP